MAICGKCGKQLEDNVKFCPVCGAPADASDGTEMSSKIKALNNVPDTTSDFDQQDIAQNKAMAILAYIGPLVLIPIFAAKGSKFARYHSNQGLLLLIAAVAWSIVYGILSGIILAISWRLYFITSILSLLSLIFLVLAILGIVNAANGKAKELPVIGKFKLLK